MDFGTIDPEGGADTFDFEELGLRVVVPMDGDAVADGVPVRMDDGEAAAGGFFSQAGEDFAMRRGLGISNDKGGRSRTFACLARRPDVGRAPRTHYRRYGSDFPR